MDFFCFDDAVRYVKSAPDNEVDIITLPPLVDSQSDNDEQFSGPLLNETPGNVEVFLADDEETDEAIDDDEWADSANPNFTSFQQPIADNAFLNHQLRR